VQGEPVTVEVRGELRLIDQQGIQITI
jgi:hypothetical protein